ncbi:MAG: DUF2461 domain-containing protein [Rhodothermales bacterium]
MPDDYPPFPGFRDEAFAFLKDLAQHNERDWFKPRKETFTDEVQWPLRCLVADAARQATHHDLSFSGDPKRSLFRIYRDTRFSKNKQPYKTHASAVLSRTGRRKEPGGLYLHIEPGHCFLAAGFWKLETPVLRRWRSRIAGEPAAFLDVRQRLEATGLTLETRESLKRMPRGFEDYAETDVAEVLRWKSFTTSRSFPDSALKTPDFTADVVQMMQDVLPLMEYGWELEDEPVG